MIVGTAGHVDHGKSALVRALTGIDPDRLKEEKARGISIELGFAHLRLDDGRELSFVDVPGHERFVATMVAGAHGIDLLLLVVAADDGVMPQTREHLAIVTLLGHSRAVVVVTKADLVDAARLAEVRGEIRALLARTPFKDAPLVAVSAVTGQGLEELKAALAAAAAAARPSAGRFRLAVDRCFSVAGAGTVVTGTVIAGGVATGDRVVVAPMGIEARVRGVQRHGRAAGHAVAGDRCALNLAGPPREAVPRGAMVQDPGLPLATGRIDAAFRLLAEAPRALGTWAPVRLHHGAAEVPARVVPLGPPLAPGQDGYVQLILGEPIAALAGDRFVLRDTSARYTMGGGTILDLSPPQRRRRTAARLAALAVLDGPPGPAMLDRLARLAPHVVDVAAFARDRDLPPEGLAAEARLEPLAGDLVVADEVLAGWRRQVAEALAAHHEAHPEQAGLRPDELRPRLDPPPPAAALWPLIERLRGEGELASSGAFAHRPGHAPRLPAAEAALWAAIAPRLGGEGRFRPPRVRDLAAVLRADERKVRTALKSAARRGEVEEVAPDHFFARATVGEMAALAAELAGSAELTAAAYRDRLGEGDYNAGRKVAIQVLEYLDRHGVTRRRGEARVIDGAKLARFLAEGRESPPVGRPDFKPGWDRQPAPGGFDSHSLPPEPIRGRAGGR